MNHPESAMQVRPSLPPVEDKPPVKLDPGHLAPAVAAGANPAASRPVPRGNAAANGPAGPGGPLSSGPLLAATF